MRTHGVIPSPDWAAHLTRALRVPSLDVVSPRDPGRLIEAHFAFMDAKVDDVTTIVYLEAFDALLRQRDVDLRPMFKRAGKSLFITRIIASRKRASRYFFEGRHRIEHADTADGGVWLLEECVRLLRGTVDRDDSASEQTLAMMHTQIATASAHLARRRDREDPARRPLLEVGLDHALRAEAVGAVDADHDGYALELALRLHELDDAGALDRVGGAQARLMTVATPTAAALTGDVLFAKAAIELAEGAVDRAAPLLAAAIERYEHGLDPADPADPTDPTDPDIGYRLAKRGRAHMLLYRYAVDRAGRRDTFHLDHALADWLDDRTSPHRQDWEVARLLLARARLFSARSDLSSARKDTQHARRLLAEAERPHDLMRLTASELEADLDTAMNHGDPDRVLTLLQTVTDIVLYAPVPSGHAAKAVRWLQSRMPDSFWKTTGERALDRVEMDVAHPALSVSARGQVATHAAVIARALYLHDGADAADTLRALELSRQQVRLATTLSAVALDGASAAASRYIYSHLGASEAADVDEVGGLEEVVTWGISGLRTARNVQHSLPARFDIAETVHRITAAARTLTAWTGDDTWLDTAGDALGLAAELAPGLPLDKARAALRAPVAAPRRRRVTLPGGPPTSGAAVPDAAGIALAAPGRAHSLWRALADVDAAPIHQRAPLRQRAAEAFVARSFDDRSLLGGKQRPGRRGVMTLADPYGLSQQLVVIKRVSHPAAQHEFDALQALTDATGRREPERRWFVPTPLGVVPIDADDAAIVMRRLPGNTLAHHVLQHLDGDEADPRHMFDVAADALGDFHRLLSRPDLAGDRVGDALRVALPLDLAPDVRRWAVQVADRVESTPWVRKKDAHGGNWLWSRTAGGLVMLDVEGTTTRPALLELVTLLDDVQVLALDDAGWAARRELAVRYLHAAGIDLAAVGDLDAVIEADLLWVATTGLRRLHRHSIEASARGLRFAGRQRSHYQAVLQFLAGRAQSDAVQALAAHLVTAAAGPTRQ